MTVSVSLFTPGILTATPAARVAVAAPVARLSLRAHTGLDQLGAALGLALPTRIGGCARTEGLQAICLGPDEWMLHAASAAVAELTAACAALYDAVPHSLVDVSGREVTFEIDGPRACDLLSIGCPRDIDSIAVGEGRRTLFDGTTVVLWRDGAEAFRMDVWNSFAPHVFALLATGCRELAAEIA